MTRQDLLPDTPAALGRFIAAHDSARAAAGALAKAGRAILLLVKRGERTVFLTLSPSKA